MKRAHYSKCILHKQDCVKFPGCYLHDRVFWKQFADCSDVVRVKKKSRFGPAVGGVSNKQHLLLFRVAHPTA